MFPPRGESSRRGFLVQAAGVAAGGAALGMAIPLPAPAATPQGLPDPIFAAIEKHKALIGPYEAACKARWRFDDVREKDDEPSDEMQRLNDAIDATHLPLEIAACELIDTMPTTPTGIIAAIRVIKAYYRDEHAGLGSGHMPSGEWLYEDEDDPRNGRDWLECFLGTIVAAVEALAIRGLA